MDVLPCLADYRRRVRGQGEAFQERHGWQEFFDAGNAQIISLVHGVVHKKTGGRQR